MDRNPKHQTKRLHVERQFICSRLGPGRLASAYERLVPVSRRTLSSPGATADNVTDCTAALQTRSAKGA